MRPSNTSRIQFNVALWLSWYALGALVCGIGSWSWSTAVTWSHTCHVSICRLYPDFLLVAWATHHLRVLIRKGKLVSVVKKPHCLVNTRKWPYLSAISKLHSPWRGPQIMGPRHGLWSFEPASHPHLYQIRVEILLGSRFFNFLLCTYTYCQIQNQLRQEHAIDSTYLLDKKVHVRHVRL